MENNYTTPVQTRIGHGHLKVSDLDRALSFYRDLLGFELTTMYVEKAAFISAGGYHHQIGLKTWHSKDRFPAPQNSAGLFHVAILYPTRKDLAEILQHLVDHEYPIWGTSDHGVSEAICHDDPDGNGVEDRPKEEWAYKDDGSVEMITRPLALEDL